MTTLKEDLSKAFFDSKDLQETINKTTLIGRHDHDYELKTIFRKHEGTTVEGDVIGDLADDLVETIERVSTKVDDIISLGQKIEEWLEEEVEHDYRVRYGEEKLSDGTEDIHSGRHECASGLLNQIKKWKKELGIETN